MGYAVKEVFKPLQGEGAHAGRAAVFCRFTGCNLWSAREADREAAACRFCDTDFVGTDGPGGGRFGDGEQLAAAVEAAWGGTAGAPFVVFTGGEPMLQLDAPLLAAVRSAMRKVVLQLVAEAGKLGATVVAADFSSVIIATGKQDLASAVGCVRL